MSMYYLIDYSNIYSKTSGSLRKYYRDDTIIYDVGLIIDFTAGANSESFKCK